jgi:hypothetical protein
MTCLNPISSYEAKAPVAGLVVVVAERAAEAGESVAAVTRALAAMTSKTFSRHFPSPPPQVCLISWLRCACDKFIYLLILYSSLTFCCCDAAHSSLLQGMQTLSLGFGQRARVFTVSGLRL